MPDHIPPVATYQPRLTRADFSAETLSQMHSLVWELCDRAETAQADAERERDEMQREYWGAYDNSASTSRGWFARQEIALTAADRRVDLATGLNATLERVLRDLDHAATLLRDLESGR